MQVTEEQFSAAKAKDARAKIITVTVGGEVVDFVTRPATRAEWKNYKALANDPTPEKAASANEQLVIFTALFPAGNELIAQIDRYPAAADIVASKVKELSGLVADAQVGESTRR